MQVLFDHSEELTKGIRTFWFKPKKPISYIAGQFIELYLPHEKTDERGQKHWFTLSSSPTEPLLSITTRIFYKRSTFKDTLLHLKPGTEVRMAEPMGDFILPKDKARRIVFVVAGIGITPMRSMVKWLKDSREKRQIHLIYAAKSEQMAVFKDLFEAYGAKIDLVLDGSLNASKILKLIGELKPDHLIYLSGPEPMVEEFDKDLKKLGVKPEQLLTDFFPGYKNV